MEHFIPLSSFQQVSQLLAAPPWQSTGDMSERFGLSIASERTLLEASRQHRRVGGKEIKIVG